MRPGLGQPGRARPGGQPAARAGVRRESHYDEAIATPHLLEEIRQGEQDGYQGFVIACFGDPGLHAAREIVSGPVVGIAEAAMRTAGYLARRLSVVAHGYGVAGLLGGIHACEIPVVELETDPAAYATILEACRSPWRRTARRRSCSAAPGWRTSAPS